MIRLEIIQMFAYTDNCNSGSLNFSAAAFLVKVFGPPEWVSSRQSWLTYFVLRT
jgi:hypothetical protein